MAIENKDKKYYKINFNSCCVRGYNVFVDYNIYDNEAERLKEKEREPLFQQFLTNLSEYINNLDEQMKIFDEILETDNLTGEQEAEYNDLVYKFNKLDYIGFYIKSNFYHINNQKSELLKIPKDILSILKELGFQEQWISDPICYTSGGTLYCGQYNNEIINYSFYYDRLKDKINPKPLENV